MALRLAAAALAAATIWTGTAALQYDPCNQDHSQGAVSKARVDVLLERIVAYNYDFKFLFLL